MATRNKKAEKSKMIVKKPVVPKADAKLRKKPKYKSFRLHKPIKHHLPPLANWLELTKKSFKLMAVNKIALLWFVLVFAILNVLLVRGFQSTVDVSEVNDLSQELFGGEFSAFSSAITSFTLFVDSSKTVSGEVAQLYQTILIIIGSLALIWLYRQQQAGNKVSMKMAFYRGMYPIIPFFLVLLVIFLQMVPALLANFLYSSAIQGNLLFGTFENVAIFVVMLLFVLLSLYMVSSSAIALYVVTLPEMTPMYALKQARELVRHRRASVFRKFMALILIVLVLLFIIVIPMIYLIPDFAEWIFFIATILAVPFVHGYLFSLYRELL